MKPEGVAILALALLVAALGLNMCALTAPHQRPERIILIEGTTPSVDVNGECIVLRYHVDGTEGFTVLRSDQEVEQYLRYLRRVGRIVKKEDL